MNCRKTWINRNRSGVTSGTARADHPAIDLCCYFVHTAVSDSNDFCERQTTPQVHIILVGPKYPAGVRKRHCICMCLRM